MTRYCSSSLAASCLLLCAMSATAMADALPPDACTEVGSACQMLDGQAGTCAQTTCSRPTFASRSGDGPMEFVEHPCNRCQLSAAGEAAPAEDDPTEPETAAEPEMVAEPETAAEPETSSTPAADSGGSSSICAVRPGSSERFGLGLLLVGMAAWVWRRARRLRE